MRIEMPKKVKSIIEKLQGAGFESYIVGGCVRDSIIGRVPDDWDITTSARPEQVKALFSRTADTGIKHGTVTVIKNHEGFEVTTYRIDGKYEDGRHPESVQFTTSLEEDLKRRDFTINAMAYNDEAGLVDIFGGMDDIRAKRIRCVGNAKDRFGEDALRMLRAVRFAAQLGFSIEEETLGAVHKLAPSLVKISAERIRSELVKLLVSPHPEMMKTVYKIGLADVFLPEFSVMMPCVQNNPYHRGTVGEHTIWAMQAVEPTKTLRLAMLLHDVAKPACRTTDETGGNHFYGHPKKGAEMAEEIMHRLRFDNETTERVVALVAAHDDRPYPITEKGVRRAIVRNGADVYPELFSVKRADIMAQSKFKREEKLKYVDDYEKIYNGIIEKEQCMSLKKLAVKGGDLIAAGMKPGPAMGSVLDAMLRDVIDNPELNDKEVLMERFEKGLYTADLE